MTKSLTTIRWILAAGTGLLSLGACATQSDHPSVSGEYLEGTALSRNPIAVEKHTEFLELDLDPRASELTNEDRRRIRAFVAGFRDRGDGPMIVSLPSASANPQLAVAAAAEVRSIAYETGVARDDIRGTTHGEQTADAAEPVLLAYQTYLAKAPDCPTFAEIQVADATNNNELATFGCSIRANQAAMIANPGDLLGQRTLGPGDLARRATVLTKFRNGESSHAARSDQERGTISQAIN